MTILVTRPSPAGERLTLLLKQVGLTALHTPLITFSAGKDLPLLSETFAELTPNDIIIAASQHAVHFADQWLRPQEKTWPMLHYIAIGQRTARELQRVTQQPVDYPKDREISEQLLKLPLLQSVAGKRILILRGNGGRDLMATTLQQRLANVICYECYQRDIITYDRNRLSQQWIAANVDTLVITSGEMLQHLYNIVPEKNRGWLLQCRLVVVSERLATDARQLGWSQCLVASNADNDALLRALQSIK